VDSQDRHTGVVSLDEEDPVFAWAISTLEYCDPSAPTSKTDDPNLALRVTVHRLADKKCRSEGRPRVRRYKVCASVGWDGSLTASAGEGFRRPPPQEEKRRSFLSRALGRRKGRGGPKGFSIHLSEVPDLKVELMEHLAEAARSKAC
jgi:hypothetical protein